MATSITLPYNEDEYYSNSGATDNQQIDEIDGEDRSNRVNCWNCKDQGHPFKDCPKQVPVGNIFCFGCGIPNVLKPHCLKCKGNRRPSSMLPGVRATASSLNPVQANPFRMNRRI